MSASGRDRGADPGDHQQRGRAHGHRPGEHEQQLDAEDDDGERQPVARAGGLRAEHQADAEQRGEAGDGQRQLAGAPRPGYDLLVRLVDLVLGSAAPARRRDRARRGRDLRSRRIAVGGRPDRCAARAGWPRGRCGGRARAGPGGPRFAAGLAARWRETRPDRARPTARTRWSRVSATLKPAPRSGAQVDEQETARRRRPRRSVTLNAVTRPSATPGPRSLSAHSVTRVPTGRRAAVAPPGRR